MPSGWSRALRFALLALLAVVGLTCNDVTFEPGLEVQSSLDLSAFATDVEIVPFPAESVIVEMRRMSDSSVAERLAFPTDTIEIQGDSAVVEFTITLETNPETFYLIARVIGDGETWLEVEDVITVTAGVGASVKELAPVYVGPGADATSILLSLSDTTITGGDSLLVTGTVYEGETAVPNAPVGFEVSDTSLVGEPRYVEPNQAWIHTPAATTGQVTVTAVTLTRNGSLRSEGTLGFFARPALIEMVSGNNQMLQPGATAPEPLVVRVRDAAGDPFTRGYPITFAVQAGPAGTSVEPADLTTDGSGLAQTTLTVGDVTGGVTVTATAEDLSGSPVTFTAGVLSGNGPEMVTWEGDAQTGTVGTALEIAPAVIVTDESGAPAEGVSVIFSVTAGGGSVEGGSAVTDANGIARVTAWTLGTTAGDNSLTASTLGLSDVIFTATGVPDVPSLMAPLSGDDQSAEAGTTLPEPLVVVVSDQYGNVVEGVAVNWQALHGAVSPTASTTDASGRAQTSWTLGVNAQTQTATAAADGTDGAAFTATAVFPNPTILLALVGTNRIPAGGSETLDITLTAPAPAGGVDVGLETENSGIAQLRQPIVTIAEGQVNARVGIDGVAAGVTNVLATAPGYADGLLAVTVSLQVLSIPAATNVPFGGTASIPIQITEPAGTGGEVVTLVSDNPTVVGVTTSSVTIPEGQIAVNGTLSGLLPGTANITATSTNFGSAAGTATTTANLNIVETSVQVSETFGDDITIRLESSGTAIAAPPGGIQVTLTPGDLSCAAVPSPVTIPAGIVDVTVTVTYGGSATTPCATVVTATAENIAEDQINVNVNPPPRVNLSNITVASGLQRAWSGSLGAINHGGVTVTLTSENAQALLLSPDASTPGTASIQVFVPDNQGGFSYHVQGVEGQSGDVSITGVATGFTDGVSTGTVVQPGVELIGPTPNITTLTPDVPFYARVGVPGVSGLSAVLQVRAGGSDLTVDIASTAPAIAQLVTEAGAQGGATTVTIPVGAFNSPTSVATGGVALEPLAEGQTTVTAKIPGFVATPAADVRVTVTQPTINLTDVTVASGLQRQWSGSLGASDHGGATVTIASENPAVLLVSPDANTAGEASIEVVVPNGQTGFSYYVQGVEGQVASALLTASETRFADGVSTGTVVQPGVELIGPTPNITTLTPDVPFYARVGVPGVSGLSAVLAVRAGGNDLTVDIGSSAPTVAQLVTDAGAQGRAATVTIPVGAFNSPTTVATGGVALEPLAEGQTTVTARIAGFVATPAADVAVTVTQPTINLTDVTVASGLQRQWSGSLGASDHGGVTVTIASENPAVLLVSPDANTAGTSSIDIQIPNGQTGFSYYVQGVEGQTGSTSIAATEPNFVTGRATVTVVQPGVQISGLAAGITTLSPDDAFFAQVGIPSGSGVSPVLAVRAGGVDLTVGFTSSAQLVGRLVDADGPQGGSATATIVAGQSNTPFTVVTGGVAFEPLTEGTTVVQAAITGFAQTTNATVTVNVTQPGISISDVTVPAGLQRGWSGFLEAPDHGGVDVTLTSSNPSVLLLSPDASTAGTSSIVIPVANGQTSFSFHVQGVEGQDGLNTTIIAVADGFGDGSATASVVTPGIALFGLNTTQTAGGANDEFWAQIGLPSGGGLSLSLSIRAGAPGPLTVTFTSSDPGVAELLDQSQNGASISLEIPVGDFRTATSFDTGGVALRPITPGSATVSVGANGYTSTDQATVQVTVNP